MICNLSFLSSRKRQDCVLSSFVFSIELEIPADMKDVDDAQIEREGIRLSFYRDNTIVHGKKKAKANKYQLMSWGLEKHISINQVYFYMIMNF